MRFLTPARAHPQHTHTHTYTHTHHTHTQRARDERGGERERETESEGGRPRRKPFFFVSSRALIRCPLASSRPTISRPPRLARYLVGLLLSPMPDQGLRGGSETSTSAAICRLSFFQAEGTMRPCRSASSCRGNSAWETVT